MADLNTIKILESYLEQVNEKIEMRRKIVSGDEPIILFRGEDNSNYDHPCQPTIFRKDYLRKNRTFEKNLFDEMTANSLTSGQTYLEKAIDAQHDGFPSRLLDVTYNLLVALYFAVTPYYRGKDAEEGSHDTKNGMVYIFFLDDIYAPTGSSINEAYNVCITQQDAAWFSETRLFQKNHKLIDHIKSNPRIIAQQGAFILFQGDTLAPIPKCQYESVEIQSEHKPILRQCLRSYFGIHTGSIYPENANLVDEMLRKSSRVSLRAFSLEDELDLIFHNIDFLMESTLDHIFFLDQNGQEDCLQSVRIAEDELMDYHILLNEWIECEDKKPDNCFPYKQYIEKFNNAIDRFADDAEALLSVRLDTPFQISRQALKIFTPNLPKEKEKGGKEDETDTPKLS